MLGLFLIILSFSLQESTTELLILLEKSTDQRTQGVEPVFHFAV
jgi:hypothetical protein